MTMPNWMFKQLDAQEEETFRKWARDHWEPHKEPDPAWHPVVKDEWKKEQDKYSEYVAAKMAGELD